VEDYEIVELFWARSETAIRETECKYARYCHSVAYGILRNDEDAQECVNDTWHKAWNAIPPARPAMIRTFLGKITRNLSLNALEKQNADKRGAGQFAVALSEIEESVPDDNSDSERFIEDEAITEVINRFLGKLPAEQRKVFVRRYWYASSLEEIAGDYGMSVGKVKSILHRLRLKLKTELEKEGISL
jgi:RNA polymerase sigma-70 factor (ECF subfamily)